MCILLMKAIMKVMTIIILMCNDININSSNNDINNKLLLMCV